jgi:hypothetical protein
MLALNLAPMEYLNLLYVIDTASLDKLPIWPTENTHKDQGFIWQPGSVGFFVDSEPPSYHLECWVEDEVRLDKTTMRAIQVPFTVGNEGITLKTYWRKEDKPLWFHVPPGDYALVFEMGNLLVGEPRLSGVVSQAFHKDYYNDPEVQEFNHQQHKIALATEQGWHQVPLIPDYDERLQCWLNDQQAQVFKLTGGDAYNRVYKPRIRLWFKQQTNAEAKILVQDSTLNPPERLDLWGHNVQSY